MAVARARSGVSEVRLTSARPASASPAAAPTARTAASLAAGLGTSVIAEVLPCMAPGGELVGPTCPEVADGLAAERARLSAVIDELVAARDILDGIISAPVPAEARAVACPAGTQY